MKHFHILLIGLVFISCKNEEVKESITNPEAYNSYLSTTNHKTFTRALSEKEFWSKRLRIDSSGVGDLGPLGNAFTLLFETSGEIAYLISAEIIYRKAMAISANSKDTYTRSLAQNLISQHRFKEAKLLLEESYKGKSNKRATRLLLFDVYLELGEFKKADQVLGYLKNTNDFNYLIRLAKWNDHHGKLDAAIRNLEEARKIVDSRKSKPLQIWTYTNLADYYGHDGRVKESYELYLKTLELQPDNAYAKKQIAWIVYSFENNPLEALRILDSVMVTYKSPDYYLLKSEIVAFNGEVTESNKMIEKFIITVENEAYVQMYASYLIEVYAEVNPQKALEIAETELKNRATPETYSLFAFAQLKVGDKKGALKTITHFVEGETFEPKSLYFSLLIYKANNDKEKVAKLTSKLKEASFELGPFLFEKIE